MNDKKSVAVDTRNKFRSVVDRAEVSTKERRAQLADVIRNARMNLLELLGLKDKSVQKQNWTVVQKRIHKEMERGMDPVLREEAERNIEILLDAESELVEGNLRLVLIVVRRYASSSYGALEEMDFVQEGCVGLLDAVRRFDFNSSRGFISYALIRIRKRVIDAIEKQHRLVRVPAHVIRKGRFLREIIDNFAAASGRYPAPHEIELETGGDMDWSILLSLSEVVESTNSSAGDRGLSLEEQLAADVTDPEEVPLGEIVEDALKKLDKRAKFVIVMRYGLLDGDNHKLSDIAEVLGLSVERTRQIEKASIRILREDFCDFDITEWLQ